MSKIDDIVAKYGKPVRYDETEKSTVFHTDMQKAFSVPSTSDICKYFIRTLQQPTIATKTVQDVARIYVIRKSANQNILSTLNLPNDNMIQMAFEEIEEKEDDLLSAIENKYNIIIYTDKSLLGFKNALTTKLMTNRQAFYEYVFDYMYLYASAFERVRMVNHIRMKMLQRDYLKQSDFDNFLRMNITEKDTIGNLIEELQIIMGQREISDCSIAVGSHIMLRVSKKLEPLTNYPIITEKMALLIEDALLSLAPFSKKQEYLKTGTTRIALTHPQWGRYRVSLGRQRGSLSISMRLIPKDIRDLKDFRLPKRIKHKLLSQQGGLYLIVGVPNSGKSTLASSVIKTMLDKENIKICSAERPIEYLFEHGQGLITQHEIGEDVSDYAHIMEMLLTYDPDVVYITETKNPTELKANIEMAEAGKQVITTFHAGSVIDALGRIKGMLQGDTLAIAGMASVLKLIIVQQLVPKSGGGVVPVQEIFNVQPSQKQALVEFDLNSLTSDLMNQKLGNRLMVNDLWNLKEKRIISQKVYEKYVDSELAQSINFVQYRPEFDTLETEEEIERKQEQTRQARDTNTHLERKRRGV